MKRRNLLAVAILSVITMSSCQGKKSNVAAKAEEPTIITDSIRFCESTYPYDGGILIANFGTEQLNPLNTEGKGYIVFAKDGKNNILIPADGNLSAPKGMFIKNNYLFICDVNKIVVYNLNKKEETPQTIRFPEDDLFINDLAASGNYLYASVTNSGRIYRIDITDLSKMSQTIPVKWVDIIGPNGIIIEDETMYVASYPADGVTTDANVIYQIANLTNPTPQVFINIPGQYDGIALSADKKTMYITNWTPAGISAANMSTKELTPIQIDDKLIGPADITVAEGIMYIPDLPNSRVIIKKL